MASEFPFKKIVGVEFSPQLHAVALANLAKHRGFQRKCDSVESLCCDFLEFPLPFEPSVLFFFNSCDASVLAKTLEKISQSLEANPRELYVIYVGPNAAQERLLDAAGCLKKVARDGEQYFCIYQAG